MIVGKYAYATIEGVISLFSNGTLSTNVIHGLSKMDNARNKRHSIKILSLYYLVLTDIHYQYRKMCILLSKYISLLHDFKQCVIICKEEKEDKRTINMTLGVSIINQNTH